MKPAADVISGARHRIRFTAAAREVLSRFAIAPVRARLRLLRVGPTGHVLVRVTVAESDAYLLRLQNPKGMSDAAARVQLGWLNALARETDLQSPAPIATAAGEPFDHVIVEGESIPRRAVLMRWVHGVRRRGADTFTRSSALCAVGIATAKLHRHATNYHLLPNQRRACPRWDIERWLGPDTCVGERGREMLSARDYDNVRRAAARIRGVLQRIGEGAEHFGLVHGDLEPPNWIFRAGQAIPIDFDEFGLGYYAIDLLQTIWTFAMSPQYPQLRTALLDGYETVRPLVTIERENLDVLQAVPFLWWMNKALAPSRSDARRDFQKWRVPTMKRIHELCNL